MRRNNKIEMIVNNNKFEDFRLNEYEWKWKKQCYTKPLHVNLKPSQMGTTIRCKKAIWLTNHLKKKCFFPEYKIWNITFINWVSTVLMSSILLPMQRFCLGKCILFPFWLCWTCDKSLSMNSVLSESELWSLKLLTLDIFIDTAVPWLMHLQCEHKDDAPLGKKFSHCVLKTHKPLLPDLFNLSELLPAIQSCATQVCRVSPMLFQNLI